MHIKALPGLHAGRKPARLPIAAPKTGTVHEIGSAVMATVGARRHGGFTTRLVEASAQGYETCMTGDYTPAMKAVNAANPEHGEPLFHFKTKEMREHQTVTGGDAAIWGLGAMSAARWKDFFDTMVSAGVYQATLDYKAGYTLEFSNKAK
jgi:hypothetical protein